MKNQKVFSVFAFSLLVEVVASCRDDLAVNDQELIVHGVVRGVDVCLNPRLHQTC